MIIQIIIEDMEKLRRNPRRPGIAILLSILDYLKAYRNKN